MKKLDIIVTLAIVIITILCGFAVYMTMDNKVYIQKYVNSETGVCYLVTNNSIIEMHNPDGSIYYEAEQSASY